MKARLAIVGLLALAALAFTYNPPGQLVSGSGTGRADDRVYAPGMRYPIEVAPSYPNSQVWGHGGSQGPGGGQCDAANYSYPWWDNYCESRSWTMPLCPSGTGHQGQDIRPSTCANNTHWAVATESGVISDIGSYSVYLRADSGTTFRYLHMEPSSLTVSVGTRVTRGQRLGRVSNAFGGTPTTIHLHFDFRQSISGVGTVYVPTYMSLVSSYEELIGMPAESCDALPASGGIIDDGGPCWQQHGPAQYWRYVLDEGHDGDLHWTYGWDGGLSNWAQWHVELEQAGTYRVEVNTVSQYAESQNVRYRIRHNGVEEDVRVDVSGASRWVTLGNFEFAAGDDQWVAVHDDTGEQSSQQREVIADAIRLSPGCADACTSGDRRCNGDSAWQVCSDSDGDGCTEWGGGGTCGTLETCAGGSCSASGCASDADCPADHFCVPSREICEPCTCDGRECGQDGCGNACGAACPAGEVCSGANVCVDDGSCTDSCAQEGAFLCSSDGRLSSCEMGADGCLEPVFVQQCEAGCDTMFGCEAVGVVCPDDAECWERECGFDPVCGISCGTCADGQLCVNAICATTGGSDEDAGGGGGGGGADTGGTGSGRDVGDGSSVNTGTGGCSVGATGAPGWAGLALGMVAMLGFRRRRR